MTTDRTALEAALDIGALMANCMFNLKQGGSIGERERAIFADLQTKWDAASRSARAALSSPPVLPAEPVATYIGRRLTPEGTKEFWGYADKPLPVGTKLYAAPQEAAPALDDARDAATRYAWLRDEAETEVQVDHCNHTAALVITVPFDYPGYPSSDPDQHPTLDDAVDAQLQQEPRS